MWKRKKKTENLRFLPTEKIYPNPYQARQEFSSEGLQRLARSIARHGMLSPLTVRQTGGEFELILGERRLRAAKLLGLDRVPCRVAEVSTKASAELVLVENLIREDLNLFEEAAALDRLIRTFSFTQTELAERLGQSQSTIANKLRLLRLSGEEKTLIVENDLTSRHARCLLRISEPRTRLFALKYIIEKGYNVHQSETFVEALLDHPEEFLLAIGPKARPRPHPVRRLVVRDVRLFVNSVDKAISGIREAGFSIEADKTEEESFISYSIRIPKYTKG